jgi:HD-like signal output (HDOD) protein
MTTATSEDKKGDALKQQRFQMLADIASEMSGEIVFPTCFDAVLRLRNALRDPDVPVERIVALVRGEPVICARLILQANAAAQGGSGEIRDIGKAVIRLGVNAVRQTALAVAMAQLVRSKELVPFSELSRVLWRHSLQTAAGAQVIAATLSRVNADEALFAGLIHDLGAFYMLYRAAQYEELRMRPDSVHYLISQWHESIGESLLHALKLLAAIIDAVRDHDQPRAPLEDDARNLGEVIYAANLMARSQHEWVKDAPALGTLGERYVQLAPQIEARFKELQAEYAR